MHLTGYLSFVRENWDTVALGKLFLSWTTSRIRNFPWVLLEFASYTCTGLSVLSGDATSYLVTTDWELEILKHYLGFCKLGEFKNSTRPYHTSLTTSLENKGTACSLNFLSPVMDGVFVSRIQFHANKLGLSWATRGLKLCSSTDRIWTSYTVLAQDLSAMIYQNTLYWLEVWNFMTRSRFLYRRIVNSAVPYLLD